MRTSMNYVRDPENLRRILALNSQMLQRPGLVGDYLNLTSPDTMVYINALNKYVKPHFLDVRSKSLRDTQNSDVEGTLRLCRS